MFLLGYVYNRIKPQPALKTFGWRYWGLSILIMALVGGLSVGGMRGGFRHSTRPINISNAAKYVERPEQVAIVLNTPFSIFRTLGKTAFKPVHFFEDQELSKIYSPVYQPEQSASGSNIEQDRPNVVLIILESFGREHIGAFNRDLEGGSYEGFTPFLDSLIEQSWAFDHAYANGRKSIDALPSVIASVPSLVQPYIVSEYSTNKINGLAGLLSRIGYETAFYHGAPNGSMGFHAFTKMAGYDAIKEKRNTIMMKTSMVCGVYGMNRFSSFLQRIWDNCRSRSLQHFFRFPHIILCCSGAICGYLSQRSSSVA